MAENISSIDVGGGKDYTTFSAWEAAKQGLIPAGDQEVAEMYGAIVMPGLIVAGWSYGDADSAMIYRPASGEKHTGVAATGARMYNTGSAVAACDFQDSTVHVDIVDLEIDAAGYNVQFFKHNVAGTFNGEMSGCLGYNNGTFFTNPGRVLQTLAISVDFNIHNCAFWNWNIPVQSPAGTSFNTNFCTSDGENAAAFTTFYKQTTTNCIGIGSTSDFNSSTGGDYNVSSDATAPGANVSTGKTTYGDYFTDRGNNDYSLKNDTATLFGLAGTPVSGITVDILGNTRDATNPDIGAFEFVPAVSPPTTTNVAVDPWNPMLGDSFTLTADINSADGDVTAAEAYLHPDPGEGNGYALTIIGSGASVAIDESIAAYDITDFPHGATFFVRGFSVEEGWGATDGAAMSLRQPKPTGVEATPADGQITADWDAMVEIEVGDSYDVFYSATSPVTDADASFSVAWNVTTKVDLLANGTERFYAVRATDGNGAFDSDLSDEVSAVAGAPVDDTSGLNLGMGLGL